MNNSTSMSLESIRLLFELERADNPRLYNDLIRFKKGTKRVNRLRTLAQEGLLAELWQIELAGHKAEGKNETASFELGDASITNQVFDEPC